jgi:hypothetical protein
MNKLKKRTKKYNKKSKKHGNFKYRVKNIRRLNVKYN